jgi:hypothetical protein
MAKTTAKQIIAKIKAEPRGFIHTDAEDLSGEPHKVAEQILDAFTDGTVLLGVTSTPDEVNVSWKAAPVGDPEPDEAA